MDVTQILGIAGAITYLASYFLLQLGFIKGEGAIYALMNILAACLVLVSLTTHFNVGSAIIQVSFISLSVIGLIRMSIAKRVTSITDIEKTLAEHMFPTVPLRRAVQAVRKGHWRTLQPQVLINEGQASTDLYFLQEGAARVTFDGKVIADLSGNQMIGDMTCLSDQTATATVTLTKPSHVFMLDSETLKNELGKNDDLLAGFDRARARVNQGRLMQLNKAVVQLQ